MWRNDVKKSTGTKEKKDTDTTTATTTSIKTGANTNSAPSPETSDMSGFGVAGTGIVAQDKSTAKRSQAAPEDSTDKLEER